MLGRRNFLSGASALLGFFGVRVPAAPIPTSIPAPEAQEYIVFFDKGGFTKYKLIDGIHEKHCDDGPAVVSYGNKSWYRNGVMHRDDGPAIIANDGNQSWYRDGKIHRDDGPAVIMNGYEWHYLNGELIKTTYQGMDVTTERSIESISGRIATRRA